MEKYRNSLKKRLIFMCLGTALFAAANVLMLVFLDISGDEHRRGFIIGFQMGLGCCALGFLISFIIKYSSAMRSDEKLKKMQIDESDERKQLIYQKSGSSGMNFAMFGLAAASIAAGYFDFTVFITLICACFFVSLTRASLKIYYRRKY